MTGLSDAALVTTDDTTRTKKGNERRELREKESKSKTNAIKKEGYRKLVNKQIK
jgi:hypothetical protein